MIARFKTFIHSHPALHEAAHLGYFVLVAVEGKGLYPIMAGCLAVFVVIHLISGEDA